MSGREVMVGSLGSVKVSPDPSSLKGCLDVVVVVAVAVEVERGSDGWG